MNIQKNPKDASAIIISYKKKVALVLRSKNKKIFYPHHYGLFGGALEKKESFLNAAAREMFEETNIFVNKNQLVFFINLNFSFPGNKKLIKRKYYIYEVKNLDEFKRNFLLGEGIKYSFFSFKEIQLLKKIVPYDKLALDLFFTKNRKFKYE